MEIKGKERTREKGRERREEEAKCGGNERKKMKERTEELEGRKDRRAKEREGQKGE